MVILMLDYLEDDVTTQKRLRVYKLKNPESQNFQLSLEAHTLCLLCENLMQRLKNHFSGVNMQRFVTAETSKNKQIPAEKKISNMGGTIFFTQKITTCYVPDVCISIFVRQKVTEFKFHIKKTNSYSI